VIVTSAYNSDIANGYFVQISEYFAPVVAIYKGVTGGIVGFRGNGRILDFVSS